MQKREELPFHLWANSLQMFSSKKEKQKLSFIKKEILRKFYNVKIDCRQCQFDCLNECHKLFKNRCLLNKYNEMFKTREQPINKKVKAQEKFHIPKDQFSRGMARHISRWMLDLLFQKEKEIKTRGNFNPKDVGFEHSFTQDQILRKNCQTKAKI